MPLNTYARSQAARALARQKASSRRGVRMRLTITTQKRTPHSPAPTSQARCASDSRWYLKSRVRHPLGMRRLSSLVALLVLASCSTSEPEAMLQEMRAAGITIVDDAKMVDAVKGMCSLNDTALEFAIAMGKDAKKPKVNESIRIGVKHYCPSRSAVVEGALAKG